MREWTPQDRELFERRATALYERAISGGLSASDTSSLSEEDRTALRLLVDLGLLIADPATSDYQATDPSTVQSRVVTPLSNRGTALLRESSDWAEAFASLAHTWRRSPQTARGPLTVLQGEPLHQFIDSVVTDAEEEILTAQPQSVRDKPSLDAALDRDVAALQRGVKIRTLYQHAARRSTMTTELVSNLSPMGAEYRTLDEFFNRMIIIDGHLAIIPSPQSMQVALAIREPNLVAYLADVFERSWTRARPFSNIRSPELRRIAQEQRSMTIRMLIAGHADPASAKRLGVSPRTYAGYVADLKQEFDAQTRFQLGYQMGLRARQGELFESPEDAPHE